MFELRLVQGGLLKKVIEAIKDLVTDANFDCSSTGFSLQAMDSSHVALVSLLLRSEGFEHFRCDRSISMGMSIANMAKMLRCASSDDIITIKADDGTDTVTFMFESPSQDKISDIEMKLMDIDSDHLGIPDVEYDSIVRMPASEFSSICSSLATIGDTVTISVSKQGVTFSTKGDIGTGKITCRQNTSTEKPEEATVIEMKEPIMLTFALKYITLFNKASTLSSEVTVSLCTDMPMVVEYKVAEMGYIRYYLAPKIEEDELESNPQAETRAPTETRAQTENPENQMEPEAEEAIPLEITPTNEENVEEAENVEVKMETESEAVDVKPKFERPREDKTMEHELKAEDELEGEEEKPKAEVEVMDI